MENEIIIYQPDETIKLDVRFENETVWLTQEQIAKLFGTKRPAITKHLTNIYKTGELDKKSTCSILEHVADKRNRLYGTVYYNLDAILSVGYRVNSYNATLFRCWATKVLKEFLLKGYALNHRFDSLENKVEKKFSEQDFRIQNLENKVDFFVKTSMPPRQGVFYDGQVFDADVFLTKFILSVRKSILLIDNYVDITSLEMLAKKGKGVSLRIVTSKRGNELAESDIDKFNEQYGDLVVSFSSKFHDRFLIIDDKELFLIGASIKDLGKRCFAFTKLDCREIDGLKGRI
ncbi:virulence RhuM family protein [bacterium]|nr:virulence RhuM family protein [bacterium]